MDWGPKMLELLWQTKIPTSRYEKCEDGAVTVDWVVLSATIVIFGSVMIGIYKGAVFDLSSAISETVVEGKPTPEDSPWR